MGPLIFSGLEPLWTPFNVIGRVLYDLSAVAVVLFTREVFRKKEPWATWAVGVTVTLLVTGFAVSGFYGDWEGLYPISNPGYWLEWLGQSTPFVWVGVEGIQNYRSARKRVRFGLTDAMVCNRFLLWSLFGVMQLATLVVLVVMNAGYEIHGHFTATTDALEGAFEMLTVAVIWLAFFPPAFYRGWIGRAAHAERASAR